MAVTNSRMPIFPKSQPVAVVYFRCLKTERTAPFKIKPACKNRVMNLFARHWFLIALATVVAVGFLSASPLAYLAEVAWLKWMIVASTMFLMAWPLELAQFRSRIVNPTAPLTAVAINTLLAPLILLPLAMLMPQDIGTSMVLVFAAPCTLASAAVWTARAGGDDSVAIMVTIITSCLCFLTTPAIIYCSIGQTTSPTVLTGMVWKLLICIVLPIGIAQVLRMQKGSADWATNNKTSVNKVAQCGILAVVFIGSISSALKISQTSTSGYAIMIVISVVLMLIVHVIVLALGLAIAKSIGLNRSEQIAVAYSGSQKTLMVALSVAASLGITVIPLVAYHSMQLFVDTLIADFWFKRDHH